jgi:hypothetical protein
MKATMQSTDKLVIINGINFRVWQGVSEQGTKFVALVNRLAAGTPDDQTKIVAELAKQQDHAPIDPALAPALKTLDPSIDPGIVEPPAKETPAA